MWRATEMTAVDERGMTKYFEELEPPEGVKVELLRGVIVMMASPDIVHNRIVADVQDQVPRQRWSRLQIQDVDITQEIVKFGDRLPLEVLGIELDTSEFGTFPGVRPHRCP
jgi:hypothetical protein